MPSSDEEGDSHSRPEVEEAFQWPPPAPMVREPLRFTEHVAAPTAPPPEVTPGFDDAPHPPPRLSPAPVRRAAGDFEDESNGMFERPTVAPPAVERASVPPLVERSRPPLESPYFKGAPPQPARAAWLKAHAPLVGLGLLALVALGEGIYILRIGRSAPASPAAAGSAAASTAAASATPPAASVPRPAGDVATGHLIIRSEPSGAAVSIDGVPFGVTPVTLAAAPVGDRRIVLRLDGREVEQTVRVEAGGTASIIAPMAPASAAASSASGSGWVSIAAGAELDILENGVLIGSTRSPKVMMPAGTHTLQLVNATLGFDASRQVRVDAGKVAKVNLVLPDGTIHLNAQPWAEVSIDGKAAGETPIANLPLGIGTHQIVFRHPELGEKTVSTVVKAGVPTRVTVDLRK